jgi:hypothetical protein
MGYQIITEETIAIRKLLKKYGNLIISNSDIDGEIIIKNYRKYRFRVEVDIEFKGKLFVKAPGTPKRDWHYSNIVTEKNCNISKRKLNRYIRMCLITSVRNRMRIFSAELTNYQEISKIKWL